MANEVKTPGIGNASRSDQHGDGSGKTHGMNSGPSTKRDPEDKASEMVDDVSHKAKEAGETLKDKASEAGHSMQEAGHTIAEKSKDAHQAICDYTRENQTAAVLASIAVGVILTRILPGR